MKPSEFMDAMTDIRSDFLAEALDGSAFPEAADAPEMTEEEPAVLHPMRSRILAVLSAAACIGLIAGSAGLIHRLKQSGPVRNPAETTAESGTETTTAATDDSTSLTAQTTAARVSVIDDGTTAGRQTQDSTADSGTTAGQSERQTGTTGNTKPVSGTVTTAATTVRGTASTVSSTEKDKGIRGADPGQVIQQLEDGVAAYVEKHFRRSDGAAVHLLDPTGWYRKEITKAPDLLNFDSFAYLYTDDLGERFSTGNWNGALANVILYSEFRFELKSLSAEESAAFDAFMTDFTAPRKTLEYHYYNETQPMQYLKDFALRAETPKQLMTALDAHPDVKALISGIEYTPVRAETVSYVIPTGGLKFQQSPNEPYHDLTKLIAERNLPWTIDAEFGITPETVTTESLLDVLTTVSSAFPVSLKTAGITGWSGIVLQDDGACVLY